MAMETFEGSYKDLRGNRCIMAVMPNITAQMCGVWQMRQNRRGEIRLIYLDGTDEIAHCPEIDMGGEYEPFAVVSAVQAKRK